LLLAGLGLAYPFAVFLSPSHVPTGALVLAALTLAAGRLAVMRRTNAARSLTPAMIGVLAVTAGLGAVDTRSAALAYPVAMSLGMAAAFGMSLFRPPSLVESLAALTEPAPTAAARSYMRTVSLVWCLFLTANGLVSALTAWLGDIEVWTLYNGLVSYLLMGALFAGEYAVRRRVRARKNAS
jgi:uncharacterized membrane protein